MAVVSIRGHNKLTILHSAVWTVFFSFRIENRAIIWNFESNTFRRSQKSRFSRPRPRHKLRKHSVETPTQAWLFLS